MKYLKEIDPKLYDDGRGAPTEPGDIEDETEVLFIARFRALESDLALQGLVLVRGDGYTEVDFRQANDDGEPVGKTYSAQIDSRGILGQLVLTGEKVVHTREGYLLHYGSSKDDEFTRDLEELLADDASKKLPAHFSYGRAGEDLAKRRLGFDSQNREFGI